LSNNCVELTRQTAPLGQNARVLPTVARWDRKVENYFKKWHLDFGNRLRGSA